MAKRWIIRLLAALFMVAICALPLVLLRDSAFAGADVLAEELTYEIAPNYQPWAKSWWTPPSSETESLLFCLQGAIGSGIFCFCAGYFLALKKYKPSTKPQENSTNDHN